jgi:hypothetical protein
VQRRETTPVHKKSAHNSEVNTDNRKTTQPYNEKHKEDTQIGYTKTCKVGKKVNKKDFKHNNKFKE